MFVIQIPTVLQLNIYEKPNLNKVCKLLRLKIFEIVILLTSLTYEIISKLRKYTEIEIFIVTPTLATGVKEMLYKVSPNILSSIITKPYLFTKDKVSKIFVYNLLKSFLCL